MPEKMNFSKYTHHKSSKIKRPGAHGPPPRRLKYIRTGTLVHANLDITFVFD